MSTKLSKPQLTALRAAAEGKLVRDETVSGRNRTRIIGGGWVNPQTRSALTSYRLIMLGPTSGVERPWLLTDAGRAALAENEEGK